MILPRLLRHFVERRVLSQTSMPWLRLSARSIAVLIRQSACTGAVASVGLSSLSCHRHGKPAVCSCQMPLHLDEHRHQDKHRTRAAAATGAAEASRGWRRGRLNLFQAAQFRGMVQGPIVQESAQVFGQVLRLLVPVFRARGPDTCG